MFTEFVGNVQRNGAVNNWIFQRGDKSLIVEWIPLERISSKRKMPVKEKIMSKGFSQEAIDLIQRYSATFHRAYFEWFADRPGEETELVKDIKRRLEENDPCPLPPEYPEGTLLWFISKPTSRDLPTVKTI
ncbi:hypothetical protein [Bifidobacterium adolescentis]|uniref:hypothetical protein n=1 Tax=Bifidobacterium adolescentis TaxID=1680 RepID=UPI004064305F